MEKNTDKVQKGNSQTNEKHTVGQSVKLSISNEGLEYYRNRIQQSGQEKYDDVVQRKELLASKKISDIDYSYEIQKKAAQQNQNVDTGKSALNITDKANNYVKAYAELYDDFQNRRTGCALGDQSACKTGWCPPGYGTGGKIIVPCASAQLV